jgi:hypothetical protein
MRKFITAVVAFSALAIGTSAQAFGASDAASARACLGNFHSEAAKALGGVGEIAVYLAGAYHPLGQAVSYEATTCDILFD